MIFWMEHNDIAPCKGVCHLGINGRNILLHSIGKFFPDANELTLLYPASLSMINSSLTPIPLVNIRHLTVYSVVPGLELLFDGNMLPHLQFLHGRAAALFMALVKRPNQTATLDTVDHLVITDQFHVAEQGFSFKQWHIVLDVVPRLRTLLIQFGNAKCPPMGMADLFMDYIKRNIRSPLTLFSCCIDHSDDVENKEHFVTYLEERIEMECSPVQLMSIGGTRLDAWM